MTFVLYDELKRLQAMDEIRERNARGVATEDHIFNLYLNATGDENEADRAATRYVLELMRAGHLRE